MRLFVYSQKPSGILGKWMMQEKVVFDIHKIAKSLGNYCWGFKHDTEHDGILSFLASKQSVILSK